MKAPLRVLILEDMEDDALLVLRELRDGGYEPEHSVVDTPEAFRAALPGRDWDIVLSDYTMPRFSAPEALSILRETGRDIPFIVVSGNIGEETAVGIMKAGASDYVMKDKIRRLASAVEREVREAATRRQARNQETRMREQAALLDISPNATLVLDREGKITYWNKGAERLFGWAAWEAVGLSLPERLFRGDSGRCSEAIDGIAREGWWAGECRIRDRDGKELIVESRWLLLPEKDGLQRTTLVVNTDMTKRRALEARHLRTHRMESIGALASGIANDLNNVLSPVAMAAEMLRPALRDPEDLRLVEILRSCSARGADLVKQILSFIRGMEGERTVLSAGELVLETTTMLRATMPDAITLRTTIDPDAWSVSGNPTLLLQGLMNLCENAMEAMPCGGTLSLTARNETVEAALAETIPGAHPGNHAVISVEDTGKGIPPEILGKIFDPFFTTKEPGKGTGLGLATAQSVVRSHDGFFTIDSRPGRGSAFRMHLPAHPVIPSAPRETKPGEVPPGHGELVLVVDDEATIRGLARAALTSFGYDVITAGDGAEGVSVFRSRKDAVKAVILDMLMPILDGPGAALALREIAPGIPIILSTGAASKEAEELLGQGLAQAVLLKPYTVANLLLTLGKALPQSTDGKTSPHTGPGNERDEKR